MEKSGELARVQFTVTPVPLAFASAPIVLTTAVVEEVLAVREPAQGVPTEGEPLHV